MVYVKRYKWHLLAGGLVLLWSLSKAGVYLGGDRSPFRIFVDFVALGFAMIVFVIPGAALYIHLDRDLENQSYSGIIPIGFVISVFFISLLGLIGRIGHFSFGLVTHLFLAIGIVEVILLFCLNPLFLQKITLRQRVSQNYLDYLPLANAFIISILMTINDRLFFIDDTTYLAYLTNWQHAAQLNFNDVVFGTGSVEASRFWLALYPMGQALLADLSGLPGILLLGNYLEIFLVPIAVLASYWFARTLGLSRRLAGFAVLFQISMYVWMVGSPFLVGDRFFRSMAEDKLTATFISAPVFIGFSLRYLMQPKSKSWFILFIISGASLTLTHAVTLFYASCIVLGSGVMAFLAKRISWTSLLYILIVIVIVLLPYLGIRLLGDESQDKLPFDAKTAVNSFDIGNRTNIVSDVFYGLNPNVLKLIDIPKEVSIYPVYQYFRLIPIVLALIAGILAVTKIDKPLAWYILASMLLIIFATIPYTGWILGYFVSARMLWRTAWFAPLGIGTAFLAKYILGWTRMLQRKHFIGNLSQSSMTLIVTFIFVSPVLLSSVLFLTPKYFDNLYVNKQLADIGAFIDKNSKGNVAVTSLINDTAGILPGIASINLLPGISAHVKVISFREESYQGMIKYFFSYEELLRRENDNYLLSSLDYSFSGEERIELIQKYHIEYILAYPEQVDVYKNFVNGKNDLIISVLYRTDDFVLLVVKRD